MRHMIIVLFLVIGTSITWGDMDFKNKNVWMQLLNDEKYNLLDKKLTRLQEEYEKNPATERNLLWSLLSFENSDPSLENKLEVWVEKKGNSIFPHLVLAMYHSHLGWLSRGTRWSKDTTSQQFAKMKAHFRKANDELKWVIDKNPRVSIAYAMLLSVTQSKKQINRYYKEGLQNNPLSSVIRTSFLSHLLPKWGGSFEEIKILLEKTRMLYKQNPALVIQEGFLEYAKGDKAFTSGSKTAYEDALKYLNKAITKSTYSKYLNRRAEVHRYMKNYDKSLEDYSQILSNLPQDVDALKGKGKVYYIQNHYDLALDSLNQALMYDKMNPFALQTRGYVYYQMKKKDKALMDLLDSLVYGYEHYKTHEYIGYIYLYHKKNYRLAAESLKTSIELGNDDINAWYLVASAQWHNRDCEFVKSAEMYAKKCKTIGTCKQKKLDWAIKSAAYAKKSICHQ
ncbi:TPR domain protein [hydrothermal vent metagenome]|uniref:TPR domain protein n=1 Tax=hydrothermal vent metagenome TaxID=652676 RepID=A0A1W1C9D8_9ZZZZ